MNRKLIYTVIFGDYDSLAEVGYVNPDSDYICITDNRDLTSKTWDVRYVNTDTDTDNDNDKARLNRLYKFFPMEFFDYESSLYIDGNISITGDVSLLFDECLNKQDISISKHPFRTCLYEEAEVCVRTGKASKNDVSLQIEKYQSEGFPKGYGLFENNVIFRKHTEAIETLMKDWHLEFSNHSKRDQLSLCYCLWKNNIKCNPFHYGPRYTNQYFDFRLHKKEENLSFIKRMALIANVRQKQSNGYFLFNSFFSLLKRFT
ncbi:DUF616 domain-containing protein [Vibrio sp. 1865]|uniref:glycosyltransferase domain-containing protein n=1 Tax=unclassified Vibrio TaxID=2614977 RepID=UPI00296422E2|nr:MULTISPECIES: glycosyltransferase domain-containing protein [unclassified Vibrio]MDW2092046.1 DUF616 domain-containing protein [Vibrio sp. 1866]MDW3102127.1 DUF616 domain-containing protein [Vibrio sp. 1874]MDW3199805.1 DUF616 domain-containing protein [Vibrio sp. 1865]